MSEKKPEEARTEPLAPTVEQGSGESDKVEADPSAQPEPTSSDTVNDNSTDSSNEETAGHGATPEEPDAGSTDGEAETGVSAAE